MCDMHLSNVDLNLLPALQALLEERNVTRAGNRVHLSQSAMSRALERLRELLHDDLLIRSGNSYELSARGSLLLRELNLLVPQLERLWDGVAFSPSQADGRIRLTMTDFASAALLPGLVQKLSHMAPLLRLELLPWQEDSFDQLLGGKTDLVFSPLAAPVPLRVERLFAESFVCLVAKEHAFKGKMFSLRQYLAETHIAIVTQPGQQTLVERPLAEAGYRRRIALQLPFFMPAVHALEGTALVLTCPSRLARDVISRYRVREVKAPPELPGFGYSMAWHPRVDGEALHLWFRELVMNLEASR